MDKEYDNKDTSIEFGKFIKELRLKRGFTLAQVAERFDVSTNYISQLERGVRNPTNELIRDFSSLYHINEDRMFRLAGKIPLSTLEEMKNTPSLQKAFSYLKKTRVSEEKKRELEEELLDVFAEFFHIHKDELLKEEIALELDPKLNDTRSGHLEKEEEE